MRFRRASGCALTLLAMTFGGCRCSKSVPSSDTVAPADARSDFGMSAPLAAGLLGEEVAVAGRDPSGHGVRVAMLRSSGERVSERLIFPDEALSKDAELKLFALHDGLLVALRTSDGGRSALRVQALGGDLVPRHATSDIATTSCATRDALLYVDGRAVYALRDGAASRIGGIPAGKDASLLCGEHRAWALLDDDESGRSVLSLDADAGAAVSLESPTLGGSGEVREHAEYVVGDDVGFVRFASSGIATLQDVRERRGRSLRTRIPDDADVVAVEASSRMLIAVYTEEVDGACAAPAVSLRVKALRVNRATFEESVVELAAGVCGREVGPFFASSAGEDVSVAWVDHAPSAGQARASIAGLVHRRVGLGAVSDLGHREALAEALVDAGCRANACFAVALVREGGAPAATLRVLRY